MTLYDNIAALPASPAPGDPGKTAFDTTVSAALKALVDGTDIGFKNFAVSLANAEATLAGQGTQGCIRMSVNLPVNTVQWRLHFRNKASNSLPGNNPPATIPGAFAMTGAWIGAHKFSTVGEPSGQFVSAPVAALPAFTTPADGSEYVSGWVTAANAQIPAFTECLLSLGWTSGPTTHAIATGPGHWLEQGASTASDAGLANMAVPVFGTAHFDVWIEYVLQGTQPLGVVIGDSRDNGVSTPQVRHTRSWPHIFSTLTGVPMLNMGISGEFALNIGDATHSTWTKWGLGSTIKPDFAVVTPDINDWIAGFPPTLVLPALYSIYVRLQSLGVKRIYVATTAPAGGWMLSASKWVRGTLAAASTVGATSIQTSIPLVVNQQITLDYGLPTQESVILNAPSTGSSAPFTTPVPALTKAHTSGAKFVNTGDCYRRDVNAVLRLQPGNVAGVIDMDKVWSDPADDYNIRAAYNGDSLHGTPDAIGAQARAFATVLSRAIMG